MVTGHDAMRGDKAGMEQMSHTRNRHKWSREDVEEMQEHQDMTSRELAELTGLTPGAIRHARSRYGRYRSTAAMLCCVCDSAPVYAESREASRLCMCESCYARWLRGKAEARRERRAAQRQLEREARKDGETGR